MRSLSLGFSAAMRSCREMLRHPWALVVVIAVATLFFLGGTWLGTWLAELTSGWVGGLIGGLSLAGSLPGWLVGAAEWISGAVVWLGTVLLISLIGGCVLLVLLSPLLSSLSDAGWKAAGRELPRDTPITLARSIGRGIMVTLRNTLMQMLLLLVSLLIGLFPVVGVVAPLLALCINAYFYGASLADYALDRAALSSADSVRFALNHRGLMVGLGLPFALLMLIPFIGKYAALFMAPCIALASGRVIGGMMVSFDCSKREQGS